MYPQLYLDQWEGITPVLLPVHALTLSCISVATVGVAVPFFVFLLAMFYLLVPIWMENFHSDKALHNIENGNAGLSQAANGPKMMMGGSLTRISRFEQPINFDMYQGPDYDYPRG